MKTILVLLALVSLSIGCSHIGPQVSGSGVRQKETRQVEPFSSITTSGAFQIEVVSQKPQTLEIEGDDNILPLITTKVSSGVLHVDNHRSYSVSEPIRIRISVPNLEGVSSSGAGKIEVSELKNEKFGIDVNGAPSIRVSGETAMLEIDTNGAGKIDARKLRAKRVVVDSNGVSKVEVHATEQLDATVSGPSQVIYQGNPVVTKTVNGPGSVEKKESEGS